MHENGADMGHLPLPIDKPIMAPERAAAATETPPGEIEIDCEQIDAPAGTSHGATPNNDVSQRRGLPRAAKRGIYRNV